MDKEIFWAVVRLVIFLPLVLLLAYFVIKYGLVRKPFVFGARRYMRVVEYLSLGPRTGLSLVQVGHDYFLLAFHEGKITLVKEFNKLPEELLVPALKPGNFGEGINWSGRIELFQKLLKSKQAKK